MNIDPHWLELGVVLVVSPIVVWYLGRINRAVDTLPVMAARIEAHQEQDDERHDSIRADIEDGKKEHRALRDKIDERLGWKTPWPKNT